MERLLSLTEMEETGFCGGRERVNPHFQLKHPVDAQKKKFLIPERADGCILDRCTRLVGEEVSEPCRNMSVMSRFMLHQQATLHISCIQRSCS